MGMLMLETCRG